MENNIISEFILEKARWICNVYEDISPSYVRMSILSDDVVNELAPVMIEEQYTREIFLMFYWNMLNHISWPGTKKQNERARSVFWEKFVEDFCPA